MREPFFYLSNGRIYRRIIYSLRSFHFEISLTRKYLEQHRYVKFFANVFDTNFHNVTRSINHFNIDIERTTLLRVYIYICSFSSNLSGIFVGNSDGLCCRATCSDHLLTRIKRSRVTWRGEAIRCHGLDRLRVAIRSFLSSPSFSFFFSSFFFFLPRYSGIWWTGARTSNEEALTIRPFEDPLTRRWSTKSWRCS